MRTLTLLLLLIGCKDPPKALGDKKSDIDAHTDPLGHDTEDVETERAVASLLANFERVHFAIDSARLDPPGRDALNANAVILQRFPQLEVEVQGHADERGTIDYNLALGQRRANAVLDALVDWGVPPSRVQLVSFGEEQPVSRANTEVAWAANRRAEFRVLANDKGVTGTVP